MNQLPYKIHQTNDTDTNFLLYLSGNKSRKYEIYRSISDTKILPNAFYNDEDQVIIFTAEKVSTLSAILSKGSLTMKNAINMVSNLSKQISYLQAHNIAFYGYNLDDIIVINETIYIIANTKNMLDIDEGTEGIYFNSPINQIKFTSPEVIKLTKLPSNVNYRSSYYSLGALICFSLLNINICSNETNIEKILEPINYTKMYWFLKRCFLPKSEERLLLFI